MKLNGIDLNKLVVFGSVARHGGYRGASEELSLTRSAISQAITGLEDSLGKKLFIRVGSRLRLTESAQDLNLELTRYHLQIQSALAQFTKKSSAVEGQLRVGAYLEFAKSKLMPVVEEFMSAYPSVQMRFTFDSPSRLKTLLENDRIDLSISIFPHSGAKTIESKKLYQEELVLIGRTEFGSTRADLAKAPVIDYYPTHLLFKRWWHRQFDQHLKAVNVVSYAGTADVVVEMVRRGLGVGVVPRYVLEALPKDERVRVLQPTTNRLFDHIWLSQFKQRDRAPAHAEFLSLLARRF
jgi:DNA-binding transcriptional LysR family regulator